MHRALLMVLPCALAFQAWRFFPVGVEMAIPIYAASGLVILAAMRLVGYRTPREAFVVCALLLMACAVFADQGALNVARIMSGGVLVALFVVALSVVEDALDAAFATGQGLTLLAWFLGNANRGTFGDEVARSALGQAYGPMAEPALWLAIMAAYCVAWYNREGNRA